MPGYLVAVTVHVLMTTQGAGVVAVYDFTAVAITTFLKSQLTILKYKCERNFSYDKAIPRDKMLDNIRECHRLHNFFIEQYKTFNSIISPVIVIYVLVCSIMICCTVVQLSIGNNTASQKLWVIEYTVALAIQLFLYCWHSKEIAYEGLENPKYPLLGPNLNGLYWFGLWQCGNKMRDGFFNFLHFWSFIFVMSSFIELYYMRNDFMKVLFNISITALSLVSIGKTVFFIFYLPHWQKLVHNISTEEIKQSKSNDPKIIEITRNYKIYSRIITFLFWSVIFLTWIVTSTSPFLKYATSSSYRESIQNGTEPYPQILSSWFPFDNTKMPGYLVAVSFHVIMTTQGTGVIAVYDSNAVAIMTFLKAQLTILKYNCERIFGDDEAIPRDKVLDNIKECHRLHNFFIKQYKTFNSIISPVMFIYVLVCSIMICCSVVQLTIGDIAASQKIWVIEYTVALAIQLFLYCWHSNEIAYESKAVDRGLYASNWWRADVLVKRQVLLLGGKLAPSFILHAGPFASFSMATFIDILKGSYSFYTLFTQMHEKEKSN